MCINVSRPTTTIQIWGKFQYRFVMQKFWFSVPPLLPRFPSSNVIWSCSLKSPHIVENASELQLTSIFDQYLLYVFMYSWVYNGCTSAVLFTLYSRPPTLMTAKMTTIFVFNFLWGHVPGGWIWHQYSSNEGPLVISMKISPNRNFLKPFLHLFVMKFVYNLHLTSHWIS